MSVLGNAKSNRHRKTHLVESGGTARKVMFLLGEISRMRVREKSAEAVVALKRGNARGAKGRRIKRKRHQHDSAERRTGGRNSHGVATSAATWGVQT